MVSLSTGHALFGTCFTGAWCVASSVGVEDTLQQNKTKTNPKFINLLKPEFFEEYLKSNFPPYRKYIAFDRRLCSVT